MTIRRLTPAAIVLALVLAGCGGSSAVKIPGSTPPGAFTTYTGSGFSVSVPTGWMHTGPVSTADGRSIVIYGAPDRSAEVQIEYDSRPSAENITLANLVSSLRTANKYFGPALKSDSIKPADATVPSAAAAKLVTVHSHGSNTANYGKLLFVRTGSGAIVQVIANRYPGNDSFDPNPVINSVRLTGS